MIVAEIEGLQISDLVKMIDASHGAGKSENHLLVRISQYGLFKV